MNGHIHDVLDEALVRLKQGEAVDEVVAAYPEKAAVLRPLLLSALSLEPLVSVPVPTEAELIQDKDLFRQQLRAIPETAVSPGLLARLKGWITIPWMSGLRSGRKERKQMSVLAKVIMAVVVVMGSLGGTAAAAANSLPDSAVYPIKLAMEDARLALVDGPTEEAAVQMDLAQERIREMTRMALDEKAPDEASMTRLQHHYERILQLAAQGPAANMAGILQQVQTMTQEQERLFTQLQNQVDEPAKLQLQVANRLLVQVRQQAEAGLMDPEGYRWMRQLHEAAPAEAPGYPMPCQGEDCEPAGFQNNFGPPMDDPGYGPGGNPDQDCLNEPCEPAGEQHQYGPEPEDAGEGPGMPGGNPDGNTTGQQNQYGDHPEDGENPGPGVPGGNPDRECPNQNCDPHSGSQAPVDGGGPVNQSGSGNGRP